MLIKQKMVYICPYCKENYNTLSEAEDCLDNHDVIFAVEENKPSCDCWGRCEDDWHPTNLIFKYYKDAKKYDCDGKYRVVIKKLY